jgi:hypothetical protein
MSASREFRKNEWEKNAARMNGTTAARVEGSVNLADGHDEENC